MKNDLWNFLFGALVTYALLNVAGAYGAGGREPTFTKPDATAAGYDREGGRMNLPCVTGELFVEVPTHGPSIVHMCNDLNTWMRVDMVVTEVAAKCPDQSVYTTLAQVSLVVAAASFGVAAFIYRRLWKGVK